MRKSKYIGTTINNLLILSTNNETDEKGVERHYFVVRCAKCNQVSKKDRFCVVKGLSKCECSYKYEKHKGTKERLYTIWTNMKARCYNKNHHRYNLYGARGIKICPEWKNSYNAFREWSINNGYQDNLTIDRINNDGNYEPSNCRWTTQKEQCNNQRKNHYLTYNGKTQSMTKWAEETGINYNTLRARINQHGYDVEKALTP